MSETLRTDQIQSFEEQFTEVKTVEVHGGVSEYVDLQPEQPTEALPILIAPGWSVGRRAWRSSAELLTSLSRYEEETLEAGKAWGLQDRRVLVVDHARRGKVLETDSQFTKEKVQKADTLLDVLDDAKVEKADVIAHSGGAIDTVAAALDQPERFNNIVLAMPAGMIGKDNVKALAHRFTSELANILAKYPLENASALTSDSIAYMGKNPPKAYREVEAIAGSAIDTTLGVLRKHGIKVGAIQAHSDPVFPADRIQRRIRLNSPLINVDAYASVFAEGATHNDPIIYPERTIYAIAQMLKSLEN